MVTATAHDIAATRTLLDAVAATRPEAIKFNPDAYVQQKLAFCIANKAYYSLLFCFGHSFLLALLHEFEHQEQYEHCQAIQAAIALVNKDTRSNLRTY